MPSYIPNQVYIEALPHDARRRVRGIRWLPFDPADGRGADGVLTVVSGGRTDPDRCYLVTEFSPASPWHGRAFVCRRAGALEPYFVFLSADDESQDHCDCAQGSYRPQTACVHRLGIRAVMSNDWLPPALGDDAPEPTVDPFA